MESGSDRAVRDGRYDPNGLVTTQTTPVCLWLEFISGITSDSVTRSVDCLIPSGSSVERSVASVLIDVGQPLAAVLVFAFIWLVIKMHRKETSIYLLKKVILSAIVVFYINYISLSKTFINILNCIEVHDSTVVEIDTVTDYWAMDTGIVCYEGSHAALTSLLGWPFLIIFTLGFPLVVAYLIVKNVSEDFKEGWIYETSGFLYRSYRSRYVFWESVIMLRKALLAVVVVFSYPLCAGLQQILSVLVLILALYSQMICRPYRQEFDRLNEMESVSILVSLLTFVSSIFYDDERVSYPVRVLVAIVISFCNVALFLSLLTAFFVFLAKYLKTAMSREGVFPDTDAGPCSVLWFYFLHRIVRPIKAKIFGS